MFMHMYTFLCSCMCICIYIDLPLESIYMHKHRYSYMMMRIHTLSHTHVYTHTLSFCLSLSLSLSLSWHTIQYSSVCVTTTGWRRHIGCLKLQDICRKRAIDYRALLRKITCKDKASYGSLSPCTVVMCCIVIQYSHVISGKASNSARF